jgi:hypothetical protein
MFGAMFRAFKAFVVGSESFQGLENGRTPEFHSYANAGFGYTLGGLQFSVPDGFAVTPEPTGFLFSPLHAPTHLDRSAYFRAWWVQDARPCTALVEELAGQFAAQNPLARATDRGVGLLRERYPYSRIEMVRAEHGDWRHEWLVTVETTTGDRVHCVGGAAAFVWPRHRPVIEWFLNSLRPPTG